MKMVVVSVLKRLSSKVVVVGLVHSVVGCSLNEVVVVFLDVVVGMVVVLEDCLVDFLNFPKKFGVVLELLPEQSCEFGLNLQ